MKNSSNPESSCDSTSRPSALAQGLAAARANLIPAIILNAVAVSIAVAYAFWPAFGEGLTGLSEVRQAYPWLYAMTATALFGAVIPFALIRLSKTRPEPLRALPYLGLVWAIKGAEVHWLYEWQAHWFGNGRDITTLLLKTAVDQGIYVPLWACPSLVIIYRFKEHGFRWHALRAEMDRRWYQRQVFPVLIMNIAIWLPTVMCIYSLPTELQLPMQNVVLCLFVLLLAFMTNAENQPQREQSQSSPTP